jgi:carbon-monoxide dehydrogenase medium subunit
MKPSPFAYHAPNTTDEAAEILGNDPEDSRLLAGGQSLVPMLNLRLVSVGNLVDLNCIPGLNHVRVEAGSVVIGALARQSDVEHSKEIRNALPVLSTAISNVAHSQIRNRGTVVGSLCHADPAAEIPAVWLALGGALTAQSTAGKRNIRPEDFFVSAFTTTLKPNEVVTEVRFDRTNGATGWSFEEVTKRPGDFALVGAVTRVTLDGGGSVSDARVVAFGVGSKPMRIPGSEEQLIGARASAVDDKLLDKAAAEVSATVNPTDDIHATGEYRRHVAGVLTRRGLRRALEAAQSRA